MSVGSQARVGPIAVLDPDVERAEDKVRERLAFYVTAVVGVLALAAVAATVALMTWWASSLSVVPDGVKVLEVQTTDGDGD